MAKTKRGNPLLHPASSVHGAHAMHREHHALMKRHKRNADGGGFRSKFGSLATVGGGVLGGATSVIVAEKAGLTPVWAGLATGGVSLAGAAMLKQPWAKELLMSAATGAAGLVGVQVAAKYFTDRSLAVQKQAQTQQATAARAQQQPKRQAEGGEYVTRDELNTALSKVAEQTRQVADQSKQQHCDLLTALGEITKIVAAAEEKNKPPQPKPSAGEGGVPKLYTVYPTRGATVDDERNAEDYERNADDYERNAYVDDERNADEYERNADDYERNAFLDEERNADEI